MERIMKRVTRRAFSQFVSGAAISLSLAGRGLRGEDPPRPLAMGKLCGHAEGFDGDGNFVKSKQYCESTDNASHTWCVEAYRKIDQCASEDIVQNYHAVEFWFVLDIVIGCNFKPDDPIEEYAVSRKSRPGCAKPRWRVVYTCKGCDDTHPTGTGLGLTKAGARIKARRNFEAKLKVLGTQCKEKKKVYTLPIQTVNTCCD
jgi:hypothetical protein